MKRLKKFLRALVAQDLVAENFRLVNEIEFYQQRIKELNDEVLALDKDRKALIDSMLRSSGFSGLYSNDPPKKTPPKMDALMGRSQARDFAREATILENEAGIDTEFRQR